MTEFVYMGIMIINNPPNNRLHSDSALRASADGRFEFCVVLVSK